MGIVAILVMWSGTSEQTFVPPSQRSSIWNLTLTGPVGSEEKMFKDCGRRQTMTDKGTTEVYQSYKLTKWAFGSGELRKQDTRIFTSQKSYETKKRQNSTTLKTAGF